MTISRHPPVVNPELQFVDDREWFVCTLSDNDKSAKENLTRIVQAEAWMHEHCSPGTAFRFGGTFYFANQEDHLEFTLIWG